MEIKDKIEESKIFILNLAKGINPITGELIEDNEVINDISISRNLFCIYDLLKDLEKMYLSSKPRKRKISFAYNKENIDKVVISKTPISLTELIRNIKYAYNNDIKLTYRIMAEVLLEENILMENPEKKPKYIATPIANDFGIYSKYVTSSKGTHLNTYYNENGQKHVIDLLEKYF